MVKTRLTALFIIILSLVLGYFVYGNKTNLPTPAFFDKFPFKLGLDLSGGTHLIYEADISNIKSAEISEAMDALRDVIERRVNLFGVSEPTIQTEEGGLGLGGAHRLIVDLPGVTDISQAVAMIGQTPLLEFKTERPESPEKENLIKKLEEAQVLEKEGKPIPFFIEDPYFISTPLSGRFLKRAILEFDQTTFEPIISLEFNQEGSKLFQQITKENIGKLVAIYLDGAPISTPVVREEISGGQAQISGNFNPKEAKTLVGRLNSGALPVPIKLISSQTVGASLGEKAVEAGLKAALFSFIILAIFFILWYRLPGILAVLTLLIYIIVMLTLFKLIPVTLTAAGLAGFIISLGVAVDANVLIFERMKEEIKNGRNITDSIQTGFKRAWFSIRDSNLTTIISAVILFWLGTSSIKGFALVLALGVIISMLSAIIITRVFLLAFGFKDNKIIKFLFSNGIK